MIETAPASSTGTPRAAAVGATGFLLSYLFAGPLSSSLATGTAPMPTAPGPVTARWVAENGLSVGVQAATMIVSVAFLTTFVVAVASLRASDSNTAHRTVPPAVVAAVGAAAAGVMIVSGVLALTMIAIVDGISADTIAALRTANFITGGTVHVALLGLFVLAASRATVFGRPLRVFAVVVAVIAVASLLSLGIFYASVLILAGRLLAMIWCVVAAVRLALRTREGIATAAVRAAQ